MAFKLHFSNDLERMADRMSADLVDAGRQLGAFSPQVIITQTEGMKSWLRLRMAEQSGVVANLEFLQPKDLVWRLQYYVLDRDLMREQLSREEMCWGLYALMGDQQFLSRFEQLRNYFDGDEIRRVAFASKLADLFDQYQIYRWRTIQEWNRMTAEELAATSDWQPWLWRKLTEKYDVAGFDRAETADRLIEALGQPVAADRVRERLPHLHVFGVAIITPFFQRIFHALSRVIDLHVYLVNPAPTQYWLDHASEKRIAYLTQNSKVPQPKGNDLLLNWGRIIRDSFSLLFKDEHLVNTCDDTLVSEPAKPETLLQLIQHSIFHNAPADELADGEFPIRKEHIYDRSIQITGCYTPVREVEVLYNYLVELCCKNDTAPLAARDILVLVPDIDLYAPYIHSVFGTSGHTTAEMVPSLPYTVADESVTREANLLSTLLRVLEFDGQAFRAEDVLDLLELPLIRRRFRISDIEEVREAVRRAEIHSGLTGDGEGENAYLYSWQHGLQRMIFGLCMKVEETHHFQVGERTVFPLDTAEGSSGLDRIRLAYFVKVLERKVAQRARHRTLSDWVEYLKEVMEDVVFQATEEQDEDYPGFVRLTEEFAEWNDPFGQEIPFSVFLHQFRGRLEAERRHSRFSIRGITFCSLVPMRSIPFRVVAMLGMNFNDFPRSEEPVRFSLLSKAELGDRNIRENDNHLFLETILSAKERLYISFLSRSDKDGSEMPPSALVDELMDFVARVVGEDTDDLRKSWVKVHPLHPFSSLYNGQEMINYLKPGRFATGIDLENRTESQSVEIKELEIQKLGDFINNPAKVFINQNFQAWFREEAELIRHHELFEMDYLSRSQMLKDLVGWPLPDDSDAVVMDYVDKTSRLGQFPAGNLGQAYVLQSLEDVKPVRVTFAKVIANAVEEKMDVKVLISGITLHGRIGRLYRHGNDLIMVIACTGSGTQKHFINAFAEWLTLLASGSKADFSLIKRDGREVRIPGAMVAADAAQRWLEKWVAMFLDGSSRLLPFYPPFFRLAVFRYKDEKDFGIKLEDALEGDGFMGIDSYFAIASNNGLLDDIESRRELVRLSASFVDDFRILGEEVVKLLES